MCGIPYQRLLLCNTVSFSLASLTFYASVVYVMALCVCPLKSPSVYLPVCLCLSQAAVLTEQLNLFSSCKQHCMIAYRDSSFFDVKTLMKFQYSDPKWGGKYTWGRKKCDLRQITRCILETVQDRHVVSIKGEQKVGLSFIPLEES